MTKRVWSSLGYCALIGVVAAWAQPTRKSGLWMIASNTRILQPGETPGNFVARGNGGDGQAPLSGSPACLTPELIHKYGVILPPSLKDCELSNVLETAASFKADMTCRGGFNGFGSVESTWTDQDHVIGKVRFVSKTRETDNARSLTWTQESTAVFKSADCGEVKPRKIPVK
jgi:hypothetical protein